ncbi:hypothetical protein T439DRAFT_364324 [Meredithblackwellia eburnea MCA 4105]
MREGMVTENETYVQDPWTKEEDGRLLESMSLQPKRPCWDKVSDFVGKGRTPGSCRRRYHVVARWIFGAEDPGLDATSRRLRWTPEEKERLSNLLRAHKSIAEIVKEFNGSRSYSAIETQVRDWGWTRMIPRLSDHARQSLGTGSTAKGDDSVHIAHKQLLGTTQIKRRKRKQSGQKFPLQGENFRKACTILAAENGDAFLNQRELMLRRALDAATHPTEKKELQRLIRTLQMLEVDHCEAHTGNSLAFLSQRELVLRRALDTAIHPMEKTELQQLAAIAT